MAEVASLIFSASSERPPHAAAADSTDNRDELEQLLVTLLRRGIAASDSHALKQ